MLSHGLVSSALFLCVGVLYDRHKTRLVRYYGGLVSTMPNLSTIFFSFTLANMSSPGTSSFIGEFLILVGAFQRNSLVATLAALGMILGAAYSLWLYNRVVSGNLKPDFLHKFSDSNGREVSIFIPFLVGGATVRWTTKEKRVNQCDHDVVGACDGTDATSLSWFGWHSPLQKSPLFLVFREPKLYLINKIRLAQGRSLFFGWAVSFWVGLRERKDGGQPCMVLLDRVSEGQLNERLMNAAGLDEPITRTRSVCFLSKNHSVTLPSPWYGLQVLMAEHEEIYHQYDYGNGNQKHDRGLRSPK